MSARCPAAVLPYRKPRAIDYSSVRVIRARAAEKLRERERAMRGSFVVGRYVDVGQLIILAAVPRGAAWNIEAGLTSDPRRMYLWNTRQAARQWLLRNPRPRCHLVNVDRLRDPAPPPAELAVDVRLRGLRRPLSKEQPDPPPASCRNGNGDHLAATSPTSRCRKRNAPKRQRARLSVKRRDNLSRRRTNRKSVA